MSVIDYSWDFVREEFSLDLDFFNEKDQEDKLWQARTGFNLETICGAIETIVFMSDKPIPLAKIKNQIDPDLPLRIVHESLARLQEEYEAKHHGIRLMEVAQGYQFRTKATYSKVIQNMFKVASMQLSPTALEVLAILAYKQPISKTAVEAIRGVDSSHIIRALMDRRLVKIVGRSEEMGRPSLFGTTTEFLEVFNLNEITDLPTETALDEIASTSEVGKISDIKLIVNAGEGKKFDFDEIDELDKLSSSIKSIQSDTLFIQSLKDMDKKRNTEEGVEKKSAFDILEEYVSKAQIEVANRESVDSECLTTVMEPKSVAASMLSELLNTPELEESELEIEFDGVECDGTNLPEMSNMDFREMNTPDVNEIELKAEQILEKSEELVASLVENAEEMLEAQATDLDTEIDEAFAALMDDDTAKEITIETAPSDIDDAVELSSALDHAFDVLMNDKEEESTEAAELSAALDNAFEDLMGDNTETLNTAKDLDLDLDFLVEMPVGTADDPDLEQDSTEL